MIATVSSNDAINCVKSEGKVKAPKLVPHFTAFFQNGLCGWELFTPIDPESEFPWLQLDANFLGNNGSEGPSSDHTGNAEGNEP